MDTSEKAYVEKTIVNATVLPQFDNLGVVLLGKVLNVSISSLYILRGRSMSLSFSTNIISPVNIL